MFLPIRCIHLRPNIFGIRVVPDYRKYALREKLEVRRETMFLEKLEIRF